MKRRVVITGMGCVTPLGSQIERVWDRLLEGESGVDEISTFDAGRFPVRIAAEVRDWSIAEVAGDLGALPQESRQTTFAVGAAVAAIRDSCLGSNGHDPRRIGVSMGCGEVFPNFLQLTLSLSGAWRGQELQRDRFLRAYTRLAEAHDELALDPSRPLGYIAAWLNAQGPSLNFTNACASSAVAVGHAMEIIRRGDADVMVAGGAHSMIHPLGITGFHRLSTLSTRNDEPRRASRPFERDRDGFVVGEGGAALIVEELEHARHRRANILAELSGYGTTHDAFRITDPRPDGELAARSVQLALQDARLSAEDIDYVNAHGSGTLANDKLETVALKRALGPHAYNVSVSSTKSMTGHLTTACGALELLICVLCLQHQAVPPTINYENRDPDCDLDYVPNVAREVHCEHVLNNNLGFGGQNVSLVVSRYDG
jgi:3-oxoacyl-[acyl-carrier-protein] synthase II